MKGTDVKGRDYTLCTLTLFNPGGEWLLEVLVLLECDGGAHLGGQYHLGRWGSLTWDWANNDFGCGSRSGSGACGGGSDVGFLLQAFLRQNAEARQDTEKQQQKEQRIYLVGRNPNVMF